MIRTQGKACQMRRRLFKHRTIKSLFASLAAAQHKRSDARSRGCSAAFEVIPDEPKGTVVGGIDDDVGVVLPAQAARLRGLAFSQHRLVESKRSEERRVGKECR